MNHLNKDAFNQSSIQHGLFLLHRARQERRGDFLERAGDLVEKTIGAGIAHSRLEAPVLAPEAAIVPAALSDPGVWYRLPIPEGLSGDGSEYHIYVRRGTCDNLCVFLSGGGVAWNAFTAAHPVTYGKMASGRPNYYWNNLRPFTQAMNIHVGITSNTRANPFHDWNFIVITYSTGDFHVGDGDFAYEDTRGEEEVLHFRGHRNFRAAMDRAAKLFPSCQKLLIAGNSAGAFAVPALTPEIVENYYPDAADVTLLSDSGQLLYHKWRETARDIWKAEKRFFEVLYSDNITLDWYEALTARFGDKLRYLYASSTHDFLLSAYYSDVTNKVYESDAEVQDAYFQQLKEMVRSLRQMAPGISFYFNRWKNPVTMGGTIHTAVREPYFFAAEPGRPSMAKWLIDAVHGATADVGDDLLARAH